MQIRSLHIKNFRSLVDVRLDLDDTTVVVGENNTGKTAVLDALRVAFSRAAPGGRRAVVTEYDFHLPSPEADPRRALPIEIDVTLREDQPDEWPSELVAALDEVVQLDPESDLDSIYFRFTCAFEQDTRQFQPRWLFLDAAGQPLRTSNAVLFDFLQHVPVFHLSALRDVADEFSPRSQFWGRLLRTMEVPEERQQELATAIEALNDELLGADPRLAQVTETLRRIRAVVSGGGDREVGIRAMPLRMWDLMSKSEIVMQGHAGGARFPLGRHGQGTQSLAVVFLFQAFVQHLLADAFGEHASPVLALEEPEAHLHPQAARALWRHVQGLAGQKIATTHSPYFVENVPFRALRLLRRDGATTRVYSLPDRFSRRVPDNDLLRDFVRDGAPKYSYVGASQTLVVRGAMSETEYRALLRAYPEPADRAAVHPELRALCDASRLFVSDEELEQLQTFARRMRGEILFARAWLLCEGPSDHVMVHRFSELLGTPLDAAGVAVIDYQNNGSPGIFVALARALGFPWFMFSDGDPGGLGQVEQVRARAPDEVAARVRTLPGQDLEAFLLANGFQAELSAVAVSLGASLPPATDPTFGDALLRGLRNRKGDYPARLWAELERAGATAARVPEFFRGLIEDVVRAAGG